MQRKQFETEWSWQGTDPSVLAEDYARTGVVRLAEFLDSGVADELYDHLRARCDWKRSIISAEGVHDIDRETMQAFPAETRAQLDEAVYARARYDFQFRYETIRIPDDRAEREAQGDVLARLALSLSSGPMRDFFRTVTGADQIDFADAQATAYSPGDFLTGHDDLIVGKDRQAAYVIGLTPTWRPEWGGLLLFHDEHRDVMRAYPPAMNIVTLFRVPQLHSVTEVTRASPYRRYSITGWLRSE